MTNKVLDLSIKVDQDEFDLLKNNVDFGKSSDALKLMVDTVVSNFDNLKNFIKDYVETKPNELLDLYYELILAYLDDLFLERGKIVDLLFTIFNFDIKLKNSRITDFLVLCNSFPVSNIKSLIQDCKFPKELLITNLGTQLLIKLNIFTAQEYKKSLEKNSVKYENYQLNNEDSLGYSILVVQLYNSFNDKHLEYKVDYYNDILIKIIGFYKLDPYRVFDIMFDVYTNNFIRNYHYLIKLLQKSPYWPDGEEHELNYDNIFSNLNKGGNQKAMEIIAMKLFYQDSRPLSETHKVLIGVLIKEGFINLGYLFNFLRPFSDDDMALIEKSYKESVLQKELSASELAMALPLEDSDDESDKKRTKLNDKKKTKDTEAVTKPIDTKLNFKLSILKACLTVGLYSESIFILGKYPYLVACDENVAMLLNRFMDLMINNLYMSTLALSSVQLKIFQTPKLVATSKSSSTNDTVNLKEFPVTHLLTFDASTQSYASKKFHFFYDWSQQLPKVENIDDLFKISNEFSSFIGSKIVKDSSLFEKLCHIIEKTEDQEKAFQYFRKFIFPFVPFIENNPTLVQSCFNILKKYDLETRYNIYGEFYQSMWIKNQDEIMIQTKKIEKETNSSLKRLTLQTAKSISRKLSKLCMTSPMVVLSKILESLESYDNLIDLIVEHLSPFLNEYAWDVLPMAILIRLTKPGRSLVQDDGLNERQWLQSLSTFIGKISRNPQMNLNPVLIYCLKKLNNGEINESIVLKDLLSIMTGIKPITNLTLEQIELLSSEKSLRKISFNLLQDDRLNSYKPAIRLLHELLKTDSLNEFFILLSSLSSNYIRLTNTDHLKILTQKNDEFESILHLYSDLINEFLKYPDFVKNVLPVDELCAVYNVQPQWSFEIWRKRLSQMIDKTILKEETKDVWNPVLLQIMGPIQKSLPHYDWSKLNIGFFVTFWQLSLYDINFSESFYDEKHSTLGKTMKALQTKLKVSSRDRDVTTTELKRIETEILANKSILGSIPGDKLKHSKHYNNVMLRLTEEKKHWLFADVDVNVQLENFLDNCLLPRSIHSPFDAIFCAKFISFWHKINDTDPNITISILDYLMNKDILNSLILTFTSTQLENFGLFYGEILRQLNNWRAEEKFNEEAIGSGLVGVSAISFTEYRQGLYKIHQNILENLKLSLQDASYITRSNCLVFLKNLLDVFPLVDEHCESLLESIELILSEDEREDLKLSSNSLIGRIKSYSTKWVALNEFYEMTEEESAEYQERRQIVRKKQERAELQRRAKIAAEEEEIRKKAAARAVEAKLKAAKEAESDNPYAKLRPSATSKIAESPEKLKLVPSAPTGPRLQQSSKQKDKTETKPKEQVKSEGPSSRESSSVPTSAEDRSKLLKEKIEAEKLRTSNNNNKTEENRPQQGRFQNVTASNADYNNGKNRGNVDRSKQEARLARFGNGKNEDSNRKRRLDDQEATTPVSEKKQRPIPTKPVSSQQQSPPPLPPPKEPAPPSGPASSQRSDSSASSFDPKKRTRLPPVVSKPNPNSGKYSVNEDYGRRPQGGYRRQYNNNRR